jgi:hypothetical protein
MPRRPSLLAIPCLALTILCVAPALGASPSKGGSYVGLVPETAARLEKRLLLKVSESGTTGRVRLSCGDTRIGLSSKFDIVKGKFEAKRQTGSTLVWRLTGKFVSGDTAKAKLYLPAVCDGKGGKVTLERDEG